MSITITDGVQAKGIWVGGLFPEIDNYDWDEVIQRAQFGSEDIDRILAYSEGDNDGPDWLLVAKLKDGRYGAVSAGCDYSGWG